MPNPNPNPNSNPNPNPSQFLVNYPDETLPTGLTHVIRQPAKFNPYDLSNSLGFNHFNSFSSYPSASSSSSPGLPQPSYYFH